MTQSSAYVINLEPCLVPLEKVDINQIVESNREPWFNQTICKVNDCLVRLGVIEGQFHWHKHTEEDEFFYVVSGHLTIDVEGSDSIDLRPGQGTLIPRTVVHRPVAHEKTIMLMFEGARVVPTGDE